MPTLKAWMKPIFSHQFIESKYKDRQVEEMTARSQSGPKPVQIHPPTKADWTTILFYTRSSSTQQSASLASLWSNQSPSYGHNRSQITILTLSCSRSHDHRHTIQYHTYEGIFPTKRFLPTNLQDQIGSIPRKAISQRLSKLRYFGPSTIDQPLLR